MSRVQVIVLGLALSSLTYQASRFRKGARAYCGQGLRPRRALRMPEVTRVHTVLSIGNVASANGVSKSFPKSESRIQLRSEPSVDLRALQLIGVKCILLTNTALLR
jgi:hypothetical protein